MKRYQSPLQIAESLSQTWSPQVISQFDDYYVKVASLKGSFVWHSHEEQDELFLILKGVLVIEYEDGNVELQTGDMHVVPRNTPHNPVADEECLVMIIEHKTTAHTGKTESSSTRSIEEQLGSFIANR